MSAPGAPEFRAALGADAAEMLDGVLDAADRRGIAVFAVGGPVRDLLMGRAIRDVDLLVEAGDVLELARSAAPEEARVAAHERFGSVSVAWRTGAIDLARARRESYAHAGALPRVEPGTLADDLARRDFSVNALALPLSRRARRDCAGIVDLADGIADLREGRLRVLHPRSFHDDPTRIWRAARLGPRLGLSLTRGSRAALRDALRDGAFGRVSGDRLRRELVKTFDDAVLGLDPSRALRLLSDWHVLGALEPGLELARAAVVPLRRLGRAIASPPWRTSRWRSWVSGLAIWLSPLPPALRARTLQRFAVRGADAQRVGRFPRSAEAWQRALQRARGRGAVDALLAALGEEELFAVYALATPKARRCIARFAREDRARRGPLDGADLLELGIEGPQLGRVLARLRVAYLDGALRTRDEALALARELARTAGRASATRLARRAGP